MLLSSLGTGVAMSQTQVGQWLCLLAVLSAWGDGLPSLLLATNFHDLQEASQPGPGPAFQTSGDSVFPQDPHPWALSAPSHGPGQGRNKRLYEF